MNTYKVGDSLIRFLTNFRPRVLVAIASGVLLAAPQLPGETAQPVSFRNPSAPLPAGGNGDSVSPVISGDGRFVLFSSSANNLVSGDNSQLGVDIFLRDRNRNAITLVSANFSGTGGGNGNSISGQASTNGCYVVFQSDSSDLIASDTNGVSDIFVRDLQAGSNILVSVAGDGTWGNGASTDSVMTPDGRFVAFVSTATNLVPNDTNGIPDVFVRDLLNRTTTLASVGGTGNAGTTISSPVLTPDGRYVAFSSTAQGLASGVLSPNQREVYIRDLISSVTLWASTNAANTASNVLQVTNAASYHPVISDDGRFVSFKTGAATGPAAAMIFQYDSLNGTTLNISSNSFAPWTQNDDVCGPEMSPDGRFVVFVATNTGCLSVQLWDAQAGTNQLVSAALDGSCPTNSVSDTPALSSDGRYVVFLSNATNLVTNTVVSGYHIFRRAILTGVTQLVDADTNGVGSIAELAAIPSVTKDGRFVVFASMDCGLVSNDNNGAYDVFLCDTVNATNELLSQHGTLPGTSTGNWLSGLGAVSMSADGRRLVYASYASDLVTNDFNNDSDVFMTDLQARGTTLVSVGLDGNAALGGSSFSPVISADGHFVAFASTATNLVAKDTNGAADIFLRNLDTGVTTLVNVNSNGATSGTGDASAPAISANGRYVGFLAKSSPAVTQSSAFWKDTIGGRMVAINTSALGTSLSISADGQRVLFFWYPSSVFAVWNAPTLANLYSSSSAVSFTALSPTGTRVAYQNTSAKQLVVYDLTGKTNMFTCADATAMKNTSAWSSDGRYLVFVTGAPLVANDSNGTNDVYLCDLQTGMVNLISANSDWASSGNGVSDLPSISGDGRFIAFRSFATNIRSGITNVPSLFVFDRMTGSNSLLAAPSPNGWTSLATVSLVSSNGNSVAFQSWNVAGITNDLNRVQDVFALPQDSLVMDSDGDGIPDWWMLKYFGHATGWSSDLSLASDDADGDGLSNLQEWLIGTDPANPTSVLALQISAGTVTSNTISLKWSAIPGKSYQVQYKDDLNEVNWTNYPGSVSLIGRQGVITIPASQATRFFRAVCVD
jgi:dipeptidyl aminopeptidase/acylaminoacyl peptidase